MRAEDLPLGDLAKWFFSFGETDPDIFPQEYLAKIWSWSHTIELSDPSSLLVPNLRAGLISRLRSAVSNCFLCPLSKHRLSGRPVLDDGCCDSYPFYAFEEKPTPVGGLSAKIMIIGEGPGQFEQRTSIPFVSYQVLAGSMCATECAEYPKCYNSDSSLPQMVCKPKSLKSGLKKTNPDDWEDTLVSIRRKRATERFDVYTAGNKLDQILFRAGLWRESWNSRQNSRTDSYDSALSPKPGTVYICNLVKCRAAEEVDVDNRKVDGLKDREPTTEEVSKCRRWLDLQVKIIQPKVIVALGKPAIKDLLSLKDIKILSERSSKTGVVHNSRYGIPTIIEVHPAFILRQEDREFIKLNTDLLVQSFELAKSISENDNITSETTQVESDSTISSVLISDAQFIPTEPP